MIDKYDRGLLEGSLSQLESASLNFALPWLSISKKLTTADNKISATAREGAIIGGGFAGGAAGGAIAGLACGPGAPVCVTVGVFVGGFLAR